MLLPSGTNPKRNFGGINIDRKKDGNNCCRSDKIRRQAILLHCILPIKEPGTKGTETSPPGFPKIAPTTFKLFARWPTLGAALHKISQRQEPQYLQPPIRDRISQQQFFTSPYRWTIISSSLPNVWKPWQSQESLPCIGKG
jgi:hypothetical protein